MKNPVLELQKSTRSKNVDQGGGGSSSSSSYFGHSSISIFCIGK